MDARQAIDMMNKNLAKIDKGLCLEITQALTDSIVSNATAPHNTEVKHGSSCSCNVQGLICGSISIFIIFVLTQGILQLAQIVFHIVWCLIILALCKIAINEVLLYVLTFFR